MKHKISKLQGFITFIGILFLLLGIFCAFRTSVNMIFYKSYPTTGLFTFSFLGYVPYSQREEDCSMLYPQPYFSADNKPLPKDEQKKMEKIQKENCLSGVKQARESARVNDISTTAFFLFMGFGILVSKRFVT